MKSITIGTRGSKLAMTQANLAAAALQIAQPKLDVRIRVISTKGDRVIDVALSKIGDKGLFVKELELALLHGEIDLAVHSAKDLPTTLLNGMTLGACLPRADARDAVVTRDSLSGADPVQALPDGARVGTSSLRRISQMRHQRPDLQIMDIRGNVDTRLSKLAAGQFDAIVLAMAGLERLGLIHDAVLHIAPLPAQVMLPAVAQGAIAIECRMNDHVVMPLLHLANHDDTQTAMLAERAFLRRLEGGCQAPIAAFAQVKGFALSIAGLISSLDGTKLIRHELAGNVADAETLGTTLAEMLLANGAQAILDDIRHSTKSLEEEQD
jgi:hydroxymethylbilane synthase